MIKFFRKIRRQLLTKNLPVRQAGQPSGQEGKLSSSDLQVGPTARLESSGQVGRYLLYAISEIILVVIGILIALAINNINERHKERKTALSYLNSLHEEFEFNLALLEKTIKISEGLSIGAENIRILFNPQVLDTVSEQRIGQVFNDLNNVTVYSPSNGALLEIISSGSLKLLENSQLKQHLAGFEKRVARIRVQEEEILRLRSEMGVFIRQKGSMAALLSIDISSDVGDNYSGTLSNKSLFKSTYFLNTIVFYGLVQKSAVDSYYIPLTHVIEEIISLIEKEIEIQS